MTMLMLLCAVLAAAADFAHREQLHERVLLEWTLRGAGAERRVEFRVTGKDAGWIGLGVSPNGGMPGSDITMAWLDAQGGQARVTDRHADAKALPKIDADQSQLELIGLNKTASGLQLHFSRPVTGCGPDDRALDGTSRIIWALGEQPAAGAEPSVHTLRGARSIVLDRADSGEGQPLRDMRGVEMLEVRHQNATTSGERTRYWWRGFRVPSDLVDNTVHIVGFEPIIDGEEDVAHHMLLHFCPTELSDEALQFVGEHTDPRAQAFFSPCRASNLVATWAVGGRAVVFPPEFGLPLGGIASRRTMFIDLHLDVADKRTVVTNAGFRLFFTRQRRPNDGAFVSIGIMSTPLSLMLPPRAAVSVRTSNCFADCLSAGLPSGGVNVVATFLHMHVAGTAIRTRHLLANGTEAPPLGDDEHYDFDLQETRFFDAPRKLSRGDSLITTCQFDTSKRTVPTVGGENTDDEMCLNFLLVWPAPAVVACQTGSAPESFVQLFTRGAFGAVAPPSIDMSSVVDPAKSVKVVKDFLGTVKDWSKFNDVWQQLEDGTSAVFQPLCIAAAGAPGGMAVPGMPIALLTPPAPRAALKAAPFRSNAARACGDEEVTRSTTAVPGDSSTTLPLRALLALALALHVN
jgi:dopamine beta-monooxygenase